jgi:hypothetical protein
MQDWRGKTNHTVAVGNGAAGSKDITQLNMRLCGELKGRRDMVAFLEGDFPSFVKFARRVHSLGSARNKSSTGSVEFRRT